jgi:poly [ADP-ribose] polymerase 16
MDNIYSILHMGLLGHFSKNALFGEGTYLSQEPSISLHYSPSNKTWSRSLIGNRMSCLLVCETINDPNHIKTGVKTAAGNQKQSSSNVPEKYFIVKNNDYVRVKYVLVYAEKSQLNRQSNRLAQIINENRFMLLLIAYSLLLMFIGLMNSRAFHKYIKLSYRKLFSLFLGETASYD